MRRACVTGAGGFIGFNMAKRLKSMGYYVRGVDLVYPAFVQEDIFDIFDEFNLADLREYDNCVDAVEGMDDVFHFAARMGGIGYITSDAANIARDNTMINISMANAIRWQGVSHFLFSSSACVYPLYKQEELGVTGLKESDAYPADPDNEYGWEKLYAERLYQNYAKTYGINIKIVRFHNVMGMFGAYDGGKEKAPAAICRKVALASDSIEIWGDGKQERSYCYIEDCLDAVLKVMYSDVPASKPLNIGSDRSVSVDQLVSIAENIADKKLNRTYKSDAAQGVRSRNSDNTLMWQTLGWAPKWTLEEGMQATYRWIEDQLKKEGRI